MTTTMTTVTTMATMRIGRPAWLTAINPRGHLVYYCLCWVTVLALASYLRVGESRSLLGVPLLSFGLTPRGGNRRLGCIADGGKTVRRSYEWVEDVIERLKGLVPEVAVLIEGDPKVGRVIVDVIEEVQVDILREEAERSRLLRAWCG